MKRTLPFPKPDREKLLLAKNLTNRELRFFAANYHMHQEMRKRVDMQLRHLGDKEEHPLISLEKQGDAYALWENIQKEIMKKHAEGHPVGRWMMEQMGVGEVLAGELLAHLGGEEVHDTVGHWWSFAGLNPEKKWERGEKRPYNAQLKQTTFHLGECFKRVSNHPDAYYGALYRQKKAEVELRNERGGFADKAASFVMREPAKQKKIRASGQVPPFYLDRWACRWVVKIFLSHVHALMYWNAYGKAPPKPFAISVLGHAHEIKIPDTDMFPGFEEAYYGGKPPQLEAAE